MFHEDILYISYCKYIKTSFLISNMHSQDLNLDNFKYDFLNISFFLTSHKGQFQKWTLMTGFVFQVHIL